MATVTKGLFFDQDYFYEESEVDENVDWKLIRPVVWRCQKVYIEELLGTPLYDVIETEIIANAGALTTGRLVTLVNTYVAPCLLYYTLMESQVSMTYKMRNRSVQTQRSGDSDEVDLQTHRYLKQEYKDIAEKFAERVEAYLIANQATYTEYTTYSTSDQVRAKSPKPSTALFMPDLPKKCINRN